MRLVMGGESLLSPLTGIGQYTYHLANELLKNPQIAELQFLIDGFLRPSTKLLKNCENMIANEKLDSTHQGASPFSRIRPIAANNKALVNLYGRIVPAIESVSLKSHGANDVFHSPNNMLARFPGRRVVTILDLSTYRHPEHHPAARVQFVNKHIENAVKHADHVLTISHTVRNEIIDRFAVSDERVSVTHLGANRCFRALSKPEFLAAAEDIGVDYKGYFLFVASIEPRKNLERLLDAYLSYREQSKSNSLPLIVIGGVGWQSDETRGRLNELAREGSLLYLGYVNQQLLTTMVAGARALLYPSVYEGFGLPVLEAMQAGTAVLTSQNTAMAEVCGGAALLIDAQDTDSILGGITLLANDLGHSTVLEQRGIERAKKFSWSTCAKATADVYELLAA